MSVDISHDIVESTPKSSMSKLLANPMNAISSIREFQRESPKLFIGAIIIVAVLLVLAYMRFKDELPECLRFDKKKSSKNDDNDNKSNRGNKSNGSKKAKNSKSDPEIDIDFDDDEQAKVDDLVKSIEDKQSENIGAASQSLD